MAWVPKRGLNVTGCEIAKLLKLTTNSVEPLSFFVPRKSETFQDDLYPDTPSNEPSHSSDEWLAGSDLPPKLVSMNPHAKGTSSISAPVKTFVAAKSATVLQVELTAANNRIQYLEEKLATAGISSD